MAAKSHRILRKSLAPPTRFERVTFAFGGQDSRRQMEGCSIFGIPQARRRYLSQICDAPCADNHATSIDMPTALHPQTQLAFLVGLRASASSIRISDKAAHID